MKVRTTGLFVLIFLCTFQWGGMGTLFGQDPPSNPLGIKLESVTLNFREDGGITLNNKECKCNSGILHFDGLDMMMSFGEIITQPEWTLERYKQDKNEFPALFIKGKNIVFEAEFSSKLPQKVKIWANDTTDEETGLGDVCKRTVVTERVDGKKRCFSGKIKFCIKNTPNKIGIIEQKWQWFYGDESNPKAIGSSEHKFYTVLRKPQSPWYKNNQKPWAIALEKAFYLIADISTNNEKKIMGELTKSMYGDTGGVFSKKPHYAGSRGSIFDLSKFILAMDRMGGVGEVNCFDMGKALVTFANILGLDSKYEQITNFKELKQCITVGDDEVEDRRFRVHAFATLQNKIYDAAIMIKVAGPNWKPVIDFNWDHSSSNKKDYKDGILLDGENVRRFKDISFEIGTIPKSTCFFWNWRKKIRDLYNIGSFRSNKYITEGSIRTNLKTVLLNSIKKCCNSKSFILEIKEEEIIAHTEEKSLQSEDWKTTNICITEYKIPVDIIANGKKEQEIISMKIVEGPIQKSLKDYLLNRYADWLSLPEGKKSTIKKTGKWHIKLDRENGPLDFDFVRYNILTMLNVRKRKNRLQTSITSIFSLKNKIDCIAKKLDDYLKDRDTGRGEKPGHGAGDEYYLNISNSFRAKRKLIVQVFKEGSGGQHKSFFYKIKPEKHKPVFFEPGDTIRIFPGFVDGCSPIGFSFKMPINGWQVCPEYSIDSFNVSFHAPSGYGKLKTPDSRGKHKILKIPGGPPIWWLEITTPLNPEIVKTLLFPNGIIDEDPKNVEVGEDDQDT